MRELMPHQKRALEYSLQNSSVALFMEMRLGKTLVAIRWAVEQSRHRHGMVLVVCPKAVIPTWLEELQKEGLEGGVLKQSCKINRDYQFQIINYELLRCREFLFEEPWDAIILDESTKIRSPKAKITKMLVAYGKYFPARAILSGMPAPESVLDYVCQMLFLSPEFMKAQNYWQWRNRYCNAYGYEWVPRIGVSQMLADEVRKRAFVMTRKSAGIGSMKVYEKRYVYMNSEQSKMYDKVEEEFAYDIKDKEITTKWSPVQFVWMARIAGGFTPNQRRINDAKIVEIHELLTGELLKEKVVIWFRFNEELNQCYAYLTSKNIKCRKILGSTSPDDRTDAVQSFRTGDTRALLVQIKCGKFGVDWSVASTAIYYSNSYEAEDRVQSEDRIVHPQKTEPLLYIDLVTKDTIDEDLVQTIQEKKADSKTFLICLMDAWRKRKCG